MKQNSKLPHSLLALDNALYECVNGIDILDVVSPTNYHEEKLRFFESQYNSNPKFQYVTTPFSLLEKKRELYNLPIDNLGNEHLFQLYFAIVQSYSDKLDQYRHLGSEPFLYDSMRYYGEPSPMDIKNADFVLHITNKQAPRQETRFGAEQIAEFFEHFADAHQLPLRIEISKSMVANALVSGDLVKVNALANVTLKEMKALAHHELGVHLLTTLNARAQPLKVLSLGSPVNTMAQEGIAILCEYLSGFMEVMRLRTLALRVKAVASMITERSFKTTFSYLADAYGLNVEQAFALTTRVYRGGGFTKDYVYLKGFQQVLEAYNTRKNLNHLLCGKVSLEQLDLVSELIDQRFLVEPKFVSPALRRPSSVDPVLKFVADSIH